MYITRINEFQAANGKTPALKEFLLAVIAAVEKAPGALHCELLADSEDKSRLVVVETWESIAAHQAAAAIIPKEKIAEVTALLAAPPQGRYYQRIV